MDEAIFYLINVKLAHRWLDGFMTFVSEFGMYGIFLTAVYFSVRAWLKQKKGVPVIRMCILFLTVFFICDRGLKQVIQRKRPESELSGIRIRTKLPDGKRALVMSEEPEPSRRRNSFPSSHTAYAFAAAFFFWLIYRKGAYLYFPIAFLVGYSRIYLAKHYPSDVIFGALLGCACAYFFYWLRKPISRPEVRKKVPLAGALLDYRSRLSPEGLRYLRLAFLVVVLLGVVRLEFIRAEVYDLAPDEAYYWNWSEHLSYGYFSKGPGIAYLIRFFTTVFDNEPHAVRLGALACSLFIGAFTYVFSLKIFRSEKTAFFTVLVVCTIPLYSAGAVIMTTDPPLTLLYGLCAYGIYKVCTTGRKAWWYASGVLLGTGILFKYSMPLIIPAIFAFLALSRNQRHWLRKKEPYLFVLTGLIFFIPMIIWNYRHDWPTIGLLMREIGVTGKTFAVSSKTFGDFLISQFFLINPFYFVLMIYGFYLAIQGYRKEGKEEYLLLFCLSGLMIAGYLIKSFFGPMQANWIAFAYLPAAILTTGFIGRKYASIKEQKRRKKYVLLFSVSIIFGTLATASGFCLNGLYRLPWKINQPKESLRNLHGAAKIVGRIKDPAFRLRGWNELGENVSRHLKERFEDPRRVFVFAHRHQLAAELGIYVKPRRRVYCANYGREKNQFDFWPGYENEPKGSDALFIDKRKEPPSEIYEEFERVEPAGEVPVTINGRHVRTFYVFHCRNFRKRVERPFE